MRETCYRFEEVQEATAALDLTLLNVKACGANRLRQTVTLVWFLAVTFVRPVLWTFERNLNVPLKGTYFFGWAEAGREVPGSDSCPLVGRGNINTNPKKRVIWSSASSVESCHGSDHNITVDLSSSIRDGAPDVCRRLRACFAKTSGLESSSVTLESLIQEVRPRCACVAG